MMIVHLVQDSSADSNLDDYVIDPLPGLETIVAELLQEDGYD